MIATDHSSLSSHNYETIFGGADRDRTDDLRLAKPALSQLSYSPGFPHKAERLDYRDPHPLNQSSPTELVSDDHNRLAPMYLVGLGRVELPTSPLSGVRSNQLSYRPVPTPHSPARYR